MDNKYINQMTAWAQLSARIAISFIISYLIISFIENSFDVDVWGMTARIFTMILTVGITCIFMEVESESKKH